MDFSLEAMTNKDANDLLEVWDNLHEMHPEADIMMTYKESRRLGMFMVNALVKPKSAVTKIHVQTTLEADE